MGTENVKTRFGPTGSVSAEYFTEAILPPLPAGLDVDAVLKTMKRASRDKSSLRRLGPFAKNGHWRGFAVKTPGDGDRTKEQAFKNFPVVIDAIRKAARLKLTGAGRPNAFVQKIDKTEDRSPTQHPEDALPDAYIASENVDGAAVMTLDKLSAVGQYERRHMLDTKTEVSALFCEAYVRQPLTTYT